jgi:integral membrane sensor domain MASE1
MVIKSFVVPCFRTNIVCVVLSVSFGKKMAAYIPETFVGS